eukprot:5860553-Pyramimonas_sp.AAC.1
MSLESYIISHTGVFSAPLPLLAQEDPQNEVKMLMSVRILIFSTVRLAEGEMVVNVPSNRVLGEYGRSDKRRYIRTTDQSYAGSAGICSRRTNQTQKAQVYSQDGPIGRRKHRFILMMDQSDVGGE